MEFLLLSYPGKELQGLNCFGCKEDEMSLFLRYAIFAVGPIGDIMEQLPQLGIYVRISCILSKEK